MPAVIIALKGKGFRRDPLRKGHIIKRHFQKSRVSKSQTASIYYRSQKDKSTVMVEFGLVMFSLIRSQVSMRLKQTLNLVRRDSKPADMK